MTRRRTTTVRAIAAIALACGTVPLVGASPAHAETASFSGVTAGYFSSTGIRKPDESPQGVPENLQPNNNGADGVGKEHLAVAARAGQVDKLSFLLFDLLSLDRGTVITKATLTMPLVPNSQEDVSFNNTPEKVVACPSGDEGFFGEDGSSLQDAPSAKCDVASAAGKLSKDGKAYEFDITKIAAGWIDMNDGVALVPATEARVQPFQVVFDKVSAAKLALEYTPATGTDVPEFPVFTPPAPDLGGFTGGNVAPPPAFDPGPAPMPEVPTAPQPQPQAAPQPQAPVISTTPVAFESLRPDAAIWLGALGLLGLLALLSLIMGDNRVPATTGSSSRLSKALADRERRGGSRPSFGRALPV